jgi:phosphoserine phosphatase RsbX
MAPGDLRIETAFAELPLPGQPESGDRCLVKRIDKGTLLAVVDGLGHGQEAASAAHAAVGAIDRYSREPLTSLVRRCHEALVGLRGVVLGIAFLDPQSATMTWLGVGNIGGVLLHVDGKARPSRVSLVPNAGFIGAEPPHATARAVPLTAHDTVVLYSDGVKEGFAESLVLANSPQEIADFIIARHTKGTDDALALVARYGG